MRICIIRTTLPAAAVLTPMRDACDVTGELPLRWRLADDREFFFFMGRCFDGATWGAECVYSALIRIDACTYPSYFFSSFLSAGGAEESREALYMVLV